MKLGDELTAENLELRMFESRRKFNAIKKMIHGIIARKEMEERIGRQVGN